MSNGKKLILHIKNTIYFYTYVIDFTCIIITTIKVSSNVFEREKKGRYMY